MTQEIAIIGAGGRMGSWFVRYFLKRNAQVSVYDLNEDSVKAFESTARISASIADCVNTADIVVVCVPVKLMPNVIVKCAAGMKAGSVIAEISSVKHRTFPVLAKLRNNLQPLCIHPMFGHGASERRQLKMLLVPVRNKEAELKILRDMFEEVTVRVLSSAKAHDDAIAVVLGLTYFANIVFAKAISRDDLSLLKDISGTTFALQSTLAESILTDEQDLISALIVDNPSAAGHIKRYLREGSTIAKLASAKSTGGLEIEVSKLKKRLQKYQDLQKSYKALNDMAETMNS